MSNELAEIREELVMVEYRITGNRLKAEFWADSIMSRHARALANQVPEETPKGRKKA